MYDLIKDVIRLSLAGLLLLATAVGADTLTLQEAIAEAQAANPGLAAIKLRAKALAEISSQAGALPDPRLSLNVANLPLDSFSLTQEGMSQIQLGITQALPYPGKLALQSQLAKLEANTAESEIYELQLQLTRDVKTVWWNLFYLDRALGAVVRNQTLLEQFVRIAETRYQVGQGLLQDILLAQLELSGLHDSDIRLHNMRDNEVSRLNVLLGRSSSHAIQIPVSVNEQLPTLVDENVLQQLAIISRPDLSSQRHRMEAARTRIDLAKKDYVPDFTLGAVYGLRSGDNVDGSRRADLGSVILSMSLPFHAGSKQDRAIDQRNAEWMQQKYQFDDHRNQTTSEVKNAINDYRYANKQVVLFKKEIVPQARQTVDAMLAGYQAGKVDFLNLVRSQTTLYNYETEYWKAISSTNQALARLVAAVGEEKVYE